MLCNSQILHIFKCWLLPHCIDIILIVSSMKWWPYLLSNGAIGAVFAFDVEQVSTLRQMNGGRYGPLAGLLNNIPLTETNGGVFVTVEWWPAHDGGSVLVGKSKETDDRTGNDQEYIQHHTDGGLQRVPSQSGEELLPEAQPQQLHPKHIFVFYFLTN